MYQIIVKKKVMKGLWKLPREVQQAFARLLNDLEESGPVQPRWPHYSMLTKDTYHCHLAYHYAACWRNENGTLIIEVYYAGSREGAPY